MVLWQGIVVSIHNTPLYRTAHDDLCHSMVAACICYSNSRSPAVCEHSAGSRSVMLRLKQRTADGHFEAGKVH